MTTVSQAIEKREQGRGALIAQYQTDFRQVLPAHIKAETFVRLAQGVLRRKADLPRRPRNNPAVPRRAPRMRPPRPRTRHRRLRPHLVPQQQDRRPRDLGIEQYQGEIERIYRAGAVLAVRCRGRPPERHRPLPRLPCGCRTRPRRPRRRR
jgi:recombination protein RecT